MNRRYIARELLMVAKELVAMDVTLGEAGLSKSWQAEFPATTECCRCGGPSRIAFVASEGLNGRESGEMVWQLHPNEGASGGPYWLHDACAVAVYLCEDCLDPTAICNQA